MYSKIALANGVPLHRQALVTPENHTCGEGFTHPQHFEARVGRGSATGRQPVGQDASK
jgi:hypothetical protein